MSDDSDWEGGAAHQALLDDISELDNPKFRTKKRVALKKAEQKVALSDLLAPIKSTRNVGALKRKLEDYEDIGEKAADATKKDEEKSRKKKSTKKAKTPKVLSAPIHRQAKNRIESEIVYADAKKDLHQWNPVVHKNRVAEQIHFPLTENPKDFGHVRTAAEKASEFEPKTALERLTAEILGKSKFNLRNNDDYCEAEREIIKSMSVKEARKKCEELQKMRALMSYKGAKLKQQAKIKSKMYHRIHKREKRRKLIKEIEELIVKDPEAAAEKIKELQKDRTHERATLKHRGVGKWSKQMKQLAAKNPEIRKILDEHLRLGSELKSHNAIDEVGDDDEDEESAVNKADEKPKKSLTIGRIVEMAADQADKEAKSSALSTDIISTENPFLKSALEAVRAERQALLEAAKLRASSQADTNASTKTNKVLVLDSRQQVSIPDDLTNGLNEYDAELQDNFLAEAYRDDDVLGEFSAEKKRVEEAEQPKVVDLNVHGWGSWTGPGIKDKYKKSLIIKPKKLNRRDAGKANVIIRETISKGVSDYQPREVPFPFTSVQDYEAYIQQPLGRDWNSEASQRALVRPRIQTAAGRIIRPLEKSEKERFIDSEDSD